MAGFSNLISLDIDVGAYQESLELCISTMGKQRVKSTAAALIVSLTCCPLLYSRLHIRAINSSSFATSQDSGGVRGLSRIPSMLTGASSRPSVEMLEYHVLLQ
jgi:hypothetical protein